MRTFMLGNVHFIIVLNVDCGTPLFIEREYWVIFLSLQSSLILFEMASFNCIKILPILQVVDISIGVLFASILRVLDILENNVILLYNGGKNYEV